MGYSIFNLYAVYYRWLGVSEPQQFMGAIRELDTAVTIAESLYEHFGSDLEDTWVQQGDARISVTNQR
jgi:hypothetical protein